MRVKAVPFKHFIGATSFEDVKIRYKKLVKTLHPDMPSGSKEAFQELQAELEYITAVIPTYPIKVGTTSFGSVDVEDIFSKMNDIFKQQQREAEELARRQRERRGQAYAKANSDNHYKTEAERWQEIKRTDSQYATVDDILDIALNTAGKTLLWMLMEVYKLDSLSLQHFKYIKFRFDSLKIKVQEGNKPPEWFRLHGEWAQEAYRNYLTIKNTRWR